jgi:hypothetical protein
VASFTSHRPAENGRCREWHIACGLTRTGSGPARDQRVTAGRWWRRPLNCRTLDRVDEDLT